MSDSYRLTTLRYALVVSMFMAIALAGCGGGGGGSSGAGANIDRATLSVAWDANPAGEAVQGYRVYFAKNGQIPLSGITDTANITDFNAIEPAVIYDATGDLGLTASDSSVCFGVVAYNGAGASDMSNIACLTL